MKSFALIFLLTGCISAPAHSSASKRRIYTPKQAIELVRACIAEQIEYCGDSICEGELEFEHVIHSTGWAVENCFDDPSSIDRRAFDPKWRAELLEKHGLPADTSH